MALLLGLTNFEANRIAHSVHLMAFLKNSSYLEVPKIPRLVNPQVFLQDLIKQMASFLLAY